MEDPTRPPSTPSQPGLPWDETWAVENAIAPNPPDTAAAPSEQGLDLDPASPEASPPVPASGAVAAPAATLEGADAVAAAKGAGLEGASLDAAKDRGGHPPASASGGDEGGDDDEEAMVKMSFLDHLEELRKRIIHSLLAIAVGFGICFWFSQRIFEYLAKPVTDVLRKLKMPDRLYFTHPADAFNVFLQIGFIAGLFLASPFVLYQLWAFISPGLYKRERKYAVPFVFFCSALFICGGLFGYLVAFPYALEFLLGMGGQRLTPWLTAKEYLDLFTTIILGLGIIFEMPVLILFLSLLRIVSPGFLMRNFRYAILVIVMIAAVVTPTTDVTNQVLFAAPMLALYLLGAGLAWLVTRHREKREEKEG